MSLLARKPVRIGRGRREARDDRVFAVATEDTHAVDQYFRALAFPRVKAGSRINFEFDYDNRESFHARNIVTDTGWKITLDRGLDIFQRYEISPFSLAAFVQEERLTKAFEVTFLRTEKKP